MSRIAILGWGSLIWDLDDLAPKISGPWRRAAGPAAPLEFSRISPKRLNALTVVIDPEVGEPRPTAVIDSARAAISEAWADLAARERTKPSGIGWLDLSADDSQTRHPSFAETVAAWCVMEGYVGAVWTDLGPNFAEKYGRAFTLAEARTYLQTLPTESLVEAVRYIESAPPETDTPLRRLLADDPWWRGLPRE